MAERGADSSGALRVRVLGPLEAFDAAGNACVVPGARLATLLGRLALEEGRPVNASGQTIGATAGRTRTRR